MVGELTFAHRALNCKMKVLLIILIPIVVCCSGDDMSITVYNSCSDAEATLELMRSVDKNKEYLKKNGIDVHVSSDTRCGYLLKRRNEQKFIEGAMTDIDLLMEAEKFFRIGKEMNHRDSASENVPSNLQNERKIELIETILNMPAVMRFSKLEFIRKEYDEISILAKDYEIIDKGPSIRQNGQSLNVLSSADSIPDNKPCYVFDKLELHGNAAYVRMTFDITGAIAYGQLNYIDGRWIPDGDFTVGVR